ncbi:MAG TPA: hypothetical protein PKC72_03070 [Chitinophagaceae bacterium]|nr:hypothetical protein [Chitinophagaceae bacterium]
MQIFQHNGIKRIISAFFLGLFLFVYAEKAFHAHDQGIVEKQNSGITKYSGKTACAICDFQLSKDFQTPLPVFVSKNFSFLKESHLLTEAQIISLTVTSSKGRAPPRC